MDKTCTQCKVPQLFKNFNFEERGKDGYRARCRSCTTAYQRAWTRANKGKVKVIQERYRKATNLVKDMPPVKKPKDFVIGEITKPTVIKNISDLLTLRNYWWFTIGECEYTIIAAIERVSMIDCI